jgi:hypothetical protein
MCKNRGRAVGVEPEDVVGPPLDGRTETRRQPSCENNRLNVDRLILMAGTEKDIVDALIASMTSRREYPTGRPPRAGRGPPTGTRPAIRFHSVPLVSDG